MHRSSARRRPAFSGATQRVKVGSRPGGRLPNSAPTGRAGVRAMRGPDCQAERREAPIRCGFARTYAPEWRANEPFSTYTRDPTTCSIRRGSEPHNQTPVQECSEKWGCKVQTLCGEIGRWGSHALLDPVAVASGAGVFLSPRPSRRNRAPLPAGCRARTPRPRRDRRSASPRATGSRRRRSRARGRDAGR
jgi:hypothetical protein